MGEKIIFAEKVYMKFNLSKDKVSSLKEYVIRFLKRQLFYDEFIALSDVSFTLDKGDVLGIIGLNGSGKSTLLKLIAGVLKPSSGKITANGRIAPLIELGAGFDSELSAREKKELRKQRFTKLNENPMINTLDALDKMKEEK